MKLKLPSLLVFGFFLPTGVQAWISPGTKSTLTSRRSALLVSSSRPTSSLNGFLDSLSPYESKIPEELKEEIYAAEANTAAASDRGQRVALYALVALIGIGFAFFNGFLTELRSSSPDGGPGVDLTEAGFGWVLDNFLFHFLFTNAIGGGICLLGGAGAGLMAEAEFDTKRINAEKIYEEMVRRRDTKAKKKNKNVSTATGRKKRRPGKEAKRLSALSEVVLDDTKSDDFMEEPKDVSQTVTEVPVDEGSTKEENKGVFGGLKDFYEKADSMAASQALLINKQLEDAGVVEKITDETGLKVIGREEAAKLKPQKGGNDTENKGEQQ